MDDQKVIVLSTAIAVPAGREVPRRSAVEDVPGGRCGGKRRWAESTRSSCRAGFSRADCVARTWHPTSSSSPRCGAWMLPRVHRPRMRSQAADVCSCPCAYNTCFAASQSFHSRQGKAYLFNEVVNVSEGPREERLMTTGTCHCSQSCPQPGVWHSSCTHT